MLFSKKTVIISHWNMLFEGLQASPQEFFAAVEKAIEAREVPDAKRSRIDWKEGGILSAKREYLRTKRKEFAFDICGAPFGNGFFVSWWLGEIPSGLIGLLLSIPIFGLLIGWMFKPLTYYRVDTALMFQSLVHSAVLEVIDDMTKSNGLRALSESERKPHMRDFFQL